MSVSGIFSSSNSNNYASAPYQLTRGTFQQLGQDLATGNLSSAQSDFAMLQQVFGQPTATGSASTSFTTNPLAQEFQQLSSDLQSGNLTAAQKDYSTIQQDMQSQFSLHMHHGHHRGGGGIESLLNDLDQNTQTTSTTSQTSSTAAQQTFATLAQQLQQYALGDAAGPASVSALTNPVSFMA